MNTNGLLRNIIVGLLFLVLLTPLFVANSLFFPYIVGKGFFFRTIIEIAFALYLVLAIRDRSYIPKMSAVTWSMISFLGVMAIATILSENPAKSFWSNYERMEGYVTLLHLAAYFVMMASVFSKKVWSNMLNSSLVASVVIGGYSYVLDRFAETPIQRIQGTFGNSTYLGVYALLHVFLAAYLALRSIERRGGLKNSLWPVIAYTAAGIFNVYILYCTGTRGSFVGLIAGALVSTILIAIFEKQRPQMRKTAIGICIAVVLVIVTLGVSKNTQFVQSSPLLSRFGALITTDIGSVIEKQGHARSLIWGMAIDGFKERPVFGWGQESFNYVFAKYYDARMYDQEQWFDRSHNVFLDWLIAGGALGLLSYLSLFFAIIYLTWRKPKHVDDSWTIAEKSVITGLLVAYFVHNLFVFDHLISYLLFFMLLAYVHERSTLYEAQTKQHAPLVASEVNQYVLFTAIGILTVATLYIGVYLPYMQNANLINALRANAGIDINGKKLVDPEKDAQVLAYFKKAIEHKAFGRVEVRERMAEIAPAVVTNSANSEDTIRGFEEMMQSEYKLQLTQTPNDPRPYMFYGMYMLQTGRTDAAIEAFKKTVELSPNKPSFLGQLSVAYFSKKDYENAVMIAKKAYEVQKSDRNTLGIYATVLVYANKLSEFDAVVLEGMTYKMDITEDPRVIQALVDTKNYSRLIAITKKKIELNPNDPQTHVSAAAVYMKIGDRQGAIRELRVAIALAPAFKAQGEAYIKTIQQGGDPSAQ